jgi:AcrR family transcriptional regulator
VGRTRDEEAKARILDASLEVLEELGYPGVTTEAIAERASASKATIYRWWPNKEAVMLEALREAVAQELPFPDTGTLKDDIRIQVHNFVKLLNSTRGRASKASSLRPRAIRQSQRHFFRFGFYRGAPLHAGALSATKKNCGRALTLRCYWMPSMLLCITGC